MEVIGVTLGFAAVMFLVSKNVNMALALMMGTAIVGPFLGVGLMEFLAIVGSGITNPMTIKLALAVALISGLGHVMKASGDLDRMINSLISIFRNAKVLSMLLPTLIGTLNVPGGAIMSAPMVEESGKRLDLDAATKTSLNLFFRHIGFFVYPLYASMILAAELFSVQKLTIIQHNFVIMIVGIVTAYFSFFRNVAHQRLARTNNDNRRRNFVGFLSGFSPIAVALFLVLALNVPFYLAAAAGVAVAMLRGLPQQDGLKGLRDRVQKFFVHWVNYKLVLVIVGVMMFQAVIGASGVVETLAVSLANYGIPLPVMVLLLGLITSYVTGVHMAATGILAALFVPLFPAELMGPYISLLFTAIIVGYVMSPIHLCLVLSNQYFEVKLAPMYRKMIIPSGAMLAAAFLQLMVLSQGVYW